MKRWEIRLQHAANCLTIGTGLAYAIFKYLPPAAADPYSRAQHPWEPAAHDLHVLAVPALVYACGVIWRSHISPQWTGQRSPTLGQGKKYSGLALLASLAPMIASGYALQVTVEDGWRRAWVVSHCVASATWTLGYVAHWLARARKPRPQT